MVDVYIYKPNFPSEWESGRIENGSWTGSIDCANVLSRYSSLIWTERYNQYGEFELCLPVCDVLSELLVRGNLLRIAKSKKWMVIEDIAVDTDPETGPMFTITGRSLESLLDRRVNLLVSESKINSSYGPGSTSNVTSVINYFVSRNFTQTSGTFWCHRLCPNFYCIPYANYSKEDSEYYDANLYALTLGDDYENYAGSALNSENVYDIVEAMCQNYDVGFAVDIQNGTNSFYSSRIKYTGDYFNFYLYYGKDRSLEQSDNSPVVLSGFFHTMQSSNYYESDRDYKNAIFVVTDEDASFNSTNSTNYYSSNTSTSPSGLNIRETYESYSTSDSVSTSKLRAEAKRTLKDLTRTTTLECEFAQTDQFVYGEDYYLGDIVSVVTDYGITATVRISEVVLSCDDSGESTSATVELIDSSGTISTGEEEDEDEGSDDSD